MVRWPRRGRGFRSARLRWAIRQRGVSASFSLGLSRPLSAVPWTAGLLSAPAPAVAFLRVLLALPTIPFSSSAGCCRSLPRMGALKARLPPAGAGGWPFSECALIVEHTQREKPAEGRGGHRNRAGGRISPGRGKDRAGERLPPSFGLHRALPACAIRTSRPCHRSDSTASIRVPGIRRRGTAAHQAP